MGYILGLETSCDETAASVLNFSGKLLSNIVHSQVLEHADYGGVVPEVAARQHIIHVKNVVLEALVCSSTDFSDLNAVAVTNGPGLAGALLVGVNYAKGLSMGLNVPLIGVNHLEGHISAVMITNKKTDYAIAVNNILEKHKMLALLVSGGHTELLLVDKQFNYEVIGETLDDAAGEAFDKVAKILGLGYPGGSKLESVARNYSGELVKVPIAKTERKYDFSFSGVKTFTLNLAKKCGIYPADVSKVDQNRRSFLVKQIANSFQHSVCKALSQKCAKAATDFSVGGVILVGGVAANSELRKQLVKALSVPLFTPPIELCTDNGAMIAMKGLQSYKLGLFSDISLDVLPNLRIGAS